jgi:hypothetical protein
VPLIFYERGQTDGVYTHTDRQRAYGSPEFAVAIKEAVLRLGDTKETLFSADDCREVQLSDNSLSLGVSSRLAFQCQIPPQTERAHQKKADPDDADRERSEHRIAEVVVTK